MLIKLNVLAASARSFQSRNGNNVIVSLSGMEIDANPLLSVLDCEFGSSEFEAMGIKCDPRREELVLAEIQKLKGKTIELVPVEFSVRGKRTQVTAHFKGVVNGAAGPATK